MRNICDTYAGGGYTLPVPDNQKYHDDLVKLAQGSDVVLGFSDEKNEGTFVNVYTGTYI